MNENLREDELHAYVDGALDDARRLEVEAWLAAHPADAARVAAWTAQSRMMHDAFDSVLNEPLPLNLVRATRRPAFAAPARAVAASLALLAAGLVGYAFGVAGQGQPTRAPAYLARDAAIAHAVFSPETRHPVEVDAAQGAHLVAWLSKRVGTPLQAPDFSAQGFSLLGGRLLSGDTGPVAQFMYEDGLERRVTLYVRRAAADAPGPTAFRHAVEKGVDVFYWIDGEFGYALSGQIGRQTMQRLAVAAYGQLTP